MMPKVIRHAGWVALLASAAASACSSPAPSADAFVNATVGSSSASQNATCNLAASVTVVALGSQNGTQPGTVPDGDSHASIQCTVSGSGSGYSLRLYANGPGGTMVVTGNVTSQGGTVSGNFLTSEGSYASNACTISYTYNGVPVPTKSPIGPGQIFGHVSCPDAQSSGTQIGSSAVSCDAEADFLFQNCGQ
ncbi:MAG: hypothetical protein ACREJ3_18140 [Polyangiaceae bacterium]